VTRLRCAVTALPGKAADPERLARSLEAAEQHGRGDFEEVVLLPSAAERPREALREAAQSAGSAGFDWLLAVGPGETVLPDLFAKLAPALRIQDAVWGAAMVATEAGLPRKPEPITRLAAQALPTMFHAALRWWIGPTHFVRPLAALRALHAPATSGWYAYYMLELWRHARAYKTAQAMTAFRGLVPELGEADRAALVESLSREPVFLTVHEGPVTAKLPYTGLNPVIEREQMRGQFFEAEELRFLAGRLPRGLRMVDAGANTGNHTVFFAAAMAAETVVPVEPHPRAAAAIGAAVAANGLANVDLSRLGIAIGAAPGRAAAVWSEGGGLGATRFEADPGGSVPVAPLDALVDSPVDFLKIDVEGMEMELLAGAMKLISRYRPILFIEVLDERVAAFMHWVDSNAYRVEKLFPDKTHCNYLLVPDDGSH